jgi:predicted AAA+ superfamily ATPase
LFKQFQQELLVSGVSEKQIVYLNLEEIENRSLLDVYLLNDYIMKLLDKEKKNYVFLDEIQMVPEFERLVDSLYVKDYIDLYITGSNAYFLSSELATLLTGRYLEIHVTPFSFAEFISYYDNYRSKYDVFDDYLFYGGLPEVSNLFHNGQKSETSNYVNTVFNTIVEKDIMKRRKILSKLDFENVAQFLFDSVGSIVSPNNISGYMTSSGNKIDNETVKNYISLMTDTFLFHQVQRYDIKGKKLLQTLNKYYATDIGFITSILGKDAKADKGHLLENIIFLELSRRYKSIYVGKNLETEVDFMVKDNDNNSFYFQVSLTVRDASTLERELRPLRSIRDHNPKYLITLDPEEPVHNGIRQVNAINWLLE